MRRTFEFLGSLFSTLALFIMFAFGFSFLVNPASTRIDIIGGTICAASAFFGLVLVLTDWMQSRRYRKRVEDYFNKY